MIKPTHKSTGGTSFHGQTFRMTPRELISLIGEPQYRGGIEDKSQYDWCLEIENTDIVFTIYDWKEYRVINEDEIIEWHIGSHKSIPEHFFQGLLF